MAAWQPQARPNAPWKLGGPMLVGEDGLPITEDPRFDKDDEISPENRVSCALHLEWNQRLHRDVHARQLDVSWYRDFIARLGAYARYGDFEQKMDALYHQVTIAQGHKYEARRALMIFLDMMVSRGEPASDFTRALDAALEARVAEASAWYEQIHALWSEMIGTHGVYRAARDEYKERRELWYDGVEWYPPYNTRQVAQSAPTDA